MNAIQAKNLVDGLSYEKEFLPIINSLFEMPFVKLPQYDQLDFINRRNKMVIEVKNRNITKQQYVDVMIGCNKLRKIRELLKANFRGFLFFNFTDGLYYYEVKTEDDEGMYVGMGGRNDRGKNERKLCYFIPNRLLTKAEKLIL